MIDRCFVSIFSLLALVAIFSCKQDKTFCPVVKNLVEAAYASGKVVPDDDHKLYAMSDGMILRRLVAEGDAVKAGALLYVIDASIQRTQTRTALTNYESAESNNRGTAPPIGIFQAINLPYFF